MGDIMKMIPPKLKEPHNMIEHLDTFSFASAKIAKQHALQKSG